MPRTYKITPRRPEVGGGWRLQLLDGDVEVGGGVFPVNADDPHAGMRWWNGCSKAERAYWMMKAASARPADAYHACLLAEAYTDAQATADQWAGPQACTNKRRPAHRGR